MGFSEQKIAGPVRGFINMIDNVKLKTQSSLNIACSLSALRALCVYYMYSFDTFTKINETFRVRKHSTLT